MYGSCVSRSRRMRRFSRDSRESADETTRGRRTLRALQKLIGSVAVVLGTTFIGFNPNREAVTLTLPGQHAVQFRNELLILAGSHSISAADVFGAVLVLAGTAALWGASQRSGLLGSTLIVAGLLVVATGSPDHDPVVVTLPRGGHGLHATDVLGMTVVVVGIVALWRSSPERGSEPGADLAG